jgi:hypothetical protein
MSDRKPQIVSVAIYPGIGVARLGDSPEGWFMGPEAPGEVPGGEPGFRFKDDEGRIKRQAARFRIYGLDAEGRAVREIHLGQKGTEIREPSHRPGGTAAPARPAHRTPGCGPRPPRGQSRRRVSCRASPGESRAAAADPAPFALRDPSRRQWRPKAPALRRWPRDGGGSGASRKGSSARKRRSGTRR